MGAELEAAHAAELEAAKYEYEHGISTEIRTALEGHLSGLQRELAEFDQRYEAAAANATSDERPRILRDSAFLRFKRVGDHLRGHVLSFALHEYLLETQKNPNIDALLRRSPTPIDEECRVLVVNDLDILKRGYVAAYLPPKRWGTGLLHALLAFKPRRGPKSIPAEQVDRLKQLRAKLTPWNEVKDAMDSEFGTHRSVEAYQKIYARIPRSATRFGGRPIQS